MTTQTVTAATDAPPADISGRNAANPVYRAISALQDEGKANAVAELVQAQCHELSDAFRKLSGADALLERARDGDVDMAEASVKEVLQALEGIMDRLDSTSVRQALAQDAPDLQGVCAAARVQS
jgi:chloramphenicol 3-O-phosphotransferase